MLLLQNLITSSIIEHRKLKAIFGEGKHFPTILATSFFPCFIFLYDAPWNWSHEQTIVWYFWLECMIANDTVRSVNFFQPRATHIYSFTQEVTSKEFHSPHTSMNLATICLWPCEQHVFRTSTRALEMDVQVRGPKLTIHYPQRKSASDPCYVLFWELHCDLENGLWRLCEQ